MNQALLNRRKQLPRLCSLLLAVCGACAETDWQQWQLFPPPSGPLKVWAVPEMIQLDRRAIPEAENEVYTESGRLVRLEAAVGETVAFQLVLVAGTEPATITGVKTADLVRGEYMIPASRITAYRQAWIPVADYPTWYLRLTPHAREPREIPDPLIPLTPPSAALPIQVAPNTLEALWVEIRVPPGTEPALYQSTIRLDLQGGAAETYNVNLNVWPFAVPQTRHLPVMAGLDVRELVRHHVEQNGQPYAPSRVTFDDPAYPQVTKVLDATIRLLHEHRLTPMLRGLQPLARTEAADRVVLDWADYDRLVAGLLDGTAFEDRAPAPAFPLPIDERDPSPEAFGGWGSPNYETMLADYLRQCVTHFEERGWLARSFLWLPVPATERGRQYQQYSRLGRIARTADRRINLVCPLTPQPMTLYGWRDDGFEDLTASVGTWATPAPLSDPDEMLRQRQAGRRTWLQPQDPPASGTLSVLGDATSPVSIPWMARRYDYDGVFLPQINAWSTAAGPLTVPAPQGSERSLLWPGKPHGLESPIPSIRLKRLLRGLEDVEYLWLLGQNKRPAVAKIIAGDLVSYGGTKCYGEHLLDTRPHGWVTDPAAWTLARRLIARELIAAMSAGSGGPENVTSFEQQIEWARLTGAVRRVRMTFEGAHVTMQPSRPDLGFDVAATVSIFNATRQPIAPQPTIEAAPPTWTAASQPSTGPNALDPLNLTRRTVRLRADGVPANADGIMPLAVKLGDASGGSVTGRLCVMTAPRLTRPITLDGKLDDWPLGAGNVAADFMLVGAQEVPKAGRLAPDRPLLRTVVFTAHTDTDLYVAFNCEDPQLASRVQSRSNTVTYDGLWPTGEDLIEVVIDPTGRAVEAGNILHVVLKGNGAVITERGAPCLDRVSPHAGWPAGVTAAIDDTTQPTRWTAEIRIPLASLGPIAPVFGINFARFHARLGEYSAWSSVPHYLYTPIALGNIRLE